MNIEKIAKAIEADAGDMLPDLRQAIAEAKARIGRRTITRCATTLDDMKLVQIVKEHEGQAAVKVNIDDL